MKKYLTAFYLLILFSCEKESFIAEETATSPQHLATTVLVENAKKYNKYFTRYGNGWTGGDATYSIALPDGRNLWMFGDSFLDTVYADRTRPGSELVRNCFVVQDGTGYNNFTTLVTGSIDEPEAFVNTPDPINEWYWPGDGTAQDDTLYVFMQLFERTGTGSFDFHYLQTDLVKFALPDLTEVNRTPVWNMDDDVYFGAAVFETDSFLNIYSAEVQGVFKYVQLSRLPLNDLNVPLEYYNATTDAWQSTFPGNSGRLKRSTSGNVDVSAQFSVFYSEGKYRLVTQEGLLGKDIFTYQSDSPQGPWSNKKKFYTADAGPDAWTYNAFVHPQILNAEGYMLMSYNINAMNFFDLFSNADLYRPKFIWIKYI